MNLEGKLLIAPPSVRGTFWEKTVIYVTEDHNQGSVGFILNKQSKLTVQEFTSQCGIDCNQEGYVYIGGPVNVKALSMLHSNDWSCNNTLRVNDDFSLSSSMEILEGLAQGDVPRYWRLLVGMSAWAPKQLHSELKGIPPYSHTHSWLTASAHYHTVFGVDGKDQWTLGIEIAGEEFAQSVLA